VLTALLVGPAWFRMHMLEAGHAQPDVVEHAQQAFHDAGLVSLAVGLGTAMLAALGVATVLNRNLSRGVEALVDGAQHVAAGHYDQPVMMTSASPELTQVADAFNHMASQIASTEQTRRRMLTDLGHELRTPLTTIRMAEDIVWDNRDELPAHARRSLGLRGDSGDDRRGHGGNGRALREREGRSVRCVATCGEGRDGHASSCSEQNERAEGAERTYGEGTRAVPCGTRGLGLVFVA